MPFYLLILSFCYLIFSGLFSLIYTFLLDFLASSKKMLYLCGRDEIINDISDDYSAAKKL